jgi:C-terminal processing protease CtpA/Prc
VFDPLWDAFDREYAGFVLRPEVDWTALRSALRPRALQCRDTFELSGVLTELLAPLRDLHVNLSLSGKFIPLFDRPRPANANPAALRVLVPELVGDGEVKWGVAHGRVGVLVIAGWIDDATPRHVDAALEDLRETAGLVVDVRLNGGGTEPLAAKVAGRFIDHPVVYGFSRFRNGPGRTNLTERAARTVEPRGPWRYERRVVVLTGRRCLSSNESFVAMMAGATNVTTMGEPTGGSSGNPRELRLPLGFAVTVPRWVDYGPDGQPIDERGIVPSLRFNGGPEAFSGDRDDLLSAAIDRLGVTP